VLDALLAIDMGNQDDALDRLEDALATAAPWTLRRPFLAQPTELQPLLAQRLERGTAAPAFARDLLERLPGTAPTPTRAGTALIDPLTTANARSCATWQAAFPTERSHPNCTCRSTPSRATNARCLANSKPKTDATPSTGPACYSYYKTPVTAQSRCTKRSN